MWETNKRQLSQATRDWDTPEVQTPFSSTNGDVMGDNGQLGADGISDSENDWDGDGLSNTYEFENGMDPTRGNDVLLRDDVSKYVKLTNTVAWDINIEKVEITGDTTGSFYVTSGGQPRTLGAGQETYVGVVFVPQAAQVLQGTLRVHYTGGYVDRTCDIPVSGEGTAL